MIAADERGEPGRKLARAQKDGEPVDEIDIGQQQRQDDGVKWRRVQTENIQQREIEDAAHRTVEVAPEEKVRNGELRGLEPPVVRHVHHVVGPEMDRQRAPREIHEPGEQKYRGGELALSHGPSQELSRDFLPDGRPEMDATAKTRVGRNPLQQIPAN